MPNIIPAGEAPPHPKTLSKETAATWLRVASSAQRLGLALVERVEREPSGYRRIDLGFTVKDDGPASTRIDRWAELLRQLEWLLAPASAAELEEWLAELSVITAQRQKAPGEGDLQLMALQDRLLGYPRCVARAALLERSYQFFPTWAEIEVNAVELNAPFEKMKRALRPEPVERVLGEARPSAAQAAAQAAVEEAAPGAHRGGKGQPPGRRQSDDDAAAGQADDPSPAQERGRRPAGADPAAPSADRQCEGAGGAEARAA